MPTRGVQSRRRRDTNTTSSATSKPSIILPSSNTDYLTLRNLFIRRMSELDPDVLYANMPKAFENLTLNEREVRFLSCF